MMSFHSLKPDVAFANDDSQHFLPKMIAMMMVLVTLILLVSLSLGSSLQSSGEAGNNRVLLHIPAQKNQESIAQKVRESFEASQHVTSAEIVSDEDLKTQMKPWLGDMEAFDALPMPKVIRVTWQAGQMPEEQALQTLMNAFDANIEVDMPSEWVKKYSYFTRVMQTALFALAMTLLAAAAALLMFVSSTSLKLHQRAVGLLHSIGASDDYIIKQFQANAAILAFKGAAIGSLSGFGLFAVIGLYTRSLNIALLPELGISVMHVLVTLCLPILAATIALFAARYATLKYLNRFL